MAFMLHSTDDGHVPAWEYKLMKAGETPQVGLGVAFDGAGKIIKSKKPTHICMHTAEAALAADAMVPVIAIAPDQVWESMLYMTPLAAVHEGTVMGLSDSALYVDPDNTADDVFRVDYVEDQTMGAAVRGRFV